jgi:tRNA pseudouridine13 synthase
MRLKQEIGDFRVRELLEPALAQDQGEHRVYRVTKRKLTSLEAAAELAREAGVPPSEVAMAGLKDRQGITIQHMSIHRGPVVSLRRADLHVETLGRTAEELSSASSSGNAFEIVVRALEGPELAALRTGLAAVRRDGLINYFDDQRFGNLRHRQGWIALDLIRGETERALKTLLCAPSRADDRRTAALKQDLSRAWGDWQACRDAAGRGGAHHSVFEHLKRSPGDFAGAFGHVSTRLRLIHLYAFQSHLWNRAVASLVRELAPLEERIVLPGADGPLVFCSGPLALPPTFRLPGPRLEDVNERERELYADVLAHLRLVPADLAIGGVPGFAFKGEDRATVVHPRHLRVRPAEPDERNPPMRKVRVRFELPRGAYATLLVRRLVAEPLGEGRGEGAGERRDEGRSEGGRSQGGAAGPERRGRRWNGRAGERGPSAGGAGRGRRRPGRYGGDRPDRGGRSARDERGKDRR